MLILTAAEFGNSAEQKTSVTLYLCVEIYIVDIFKLIIIK